MPATMLRDDATRMLLIRAATMWLLVRLVFLAIGVANSAVVPMSPLAVAGLTTLLCIGEWRRRREGAFWRNLGVGVRTMIAIALSAAMIGELSLILLRSVIPHG